MFPRRNSLDRIVILFLLALVLIPALAAAASVVSTSATTGTTMSVSLDTAASKPPWFAGLATWLSGAMALIFAYLAKVIGQGLASVFASLVAQAGYRLDANREAAIAAFIETQIRSQEEKHASGLYDKAANAGATKLEQVVTAVSAKFPKLNADDINTRIHAIIQKLPTVGATK